MDREFLEKLLEKLSNCSLEKLGIIKTVWPKEALKAGVPEEYISLLPDIVNVVIGERLKTQECANTWTRRQVAYRIIVKDGREGGEMTKHIENIRNEYRQAIFTNVSGIKDTIALRDMVKLSDILRRHYSNTGNETVSTDEYKLLSIFRGSMKLNSNTLDNIEFFVTALTQEPPKSNKPQRSGNS